MPEQEEKEELEDDEDLEDLDEDPEEVEAKLALSTDDDESEESSLDELLSQRAAARRGTDESNDEDDIMSLASEKEPDVIKEVIPAVVIPVKDRHEFVCKQCHLVKLRAQLKDEERMLCRDCA